MFTTSSSNKRSTFYLAGWLFADLLLGLWVVFMVTNVPPKQEPVPLTPTPAATFTPTVTATQTHPATPTPTSTPLPTDIGPVGLSKAQCYNLELENTFSGQASETQSILYQLNGQIPNDAKSRAGLVLIWGHGKDIYDGRQLAMRVGKVIRDNFPLSFGPETSMKSLGFDHGAYKHVQVEIYFFTDGEWHSGRETKCEFVD